MNNIYSCIVHRDDTVLVLKRSTKMKHKNEWQFPGGEPFVDEEPIKAAKRHLRSQTQLEPSSTTLLEIIPASNGKTCWFYEAKVDSHDISLNWESSTYRWVTLDDLESLHLFWAAKLYANKLIKEQRLEFRTQLVNGELFLAISGKLHDTVVATARMCIPTKKLHDVNVLPEFRGKGYAKQLMKYIMNLPSHPTTLTAKASRNSSLDTMQLSNFYKGFGFEIEARGVHELKMRLKRK